MDAARGHPSEVGFPSGEQRPALGLGCWRFGEDAGRHGAEVASLRQGLEMGPDMGLDMDLDMAMGLHMAMDMGWCVFDTAEMYGSGGAETVAGQALAEAQRGGVARGDLFVVSKVQPDHATERGLRAACATNPVYYPLSQRGVQHDLLPWQRQQQMPLMAYSTFDQGEPVHHPRLRPVAERHPATPAQVALAWPLRQQGVMAIPE